jgi:hypothetical protein
VPTAETAVAAAGAAAAASAVFFLSGADTFLELEREFVLGLDTVFAYFLKLGGAPSSSNSYFVLFDSPDDDFLFALALALALALAPRLLDFIFSHDESLS